MKLHYLFTLFTFILFSCKSIAKKAIPTSEILFSKENFSKPKIATKDFTLNKDKYLSIYFNLDKPLVQSLKEIDSTLTEDELLNKGNFQFSFFVDNQLIYTENLHKGAGLKESKTTQLEHTIPLISPKKMDFWGWFMWLKFMKLGGGQDALEKGNHTLKIEVKPYLKNDQLKVGKLLAKGQINITVLEIKVDEKLVEIQQIKDGSGWELSNDNFDRSKIEALNKKIAQKRFENINGIVVIKNQKLLIEEYFNGSNRNSLHDARSVGKTIASTMLGIAIKDQHIKNEHQLLSDFYNLKDYKNYSKKKDSVTLQSLLTMTSAFSGDDNDYSSLGNEENMYPTKNWVNFALDLPMNEHERIGKNFSYFTAGVVVLGDIIHKSVPKGLVSYADKKLFAPLGISNYQWEFTPQKVGNTAGGIRLRAIDFAKYGQLYKNKGLWNGQQILSGKWIEKSFSKHVEQSLDKGHYGYLFWNKTFEINEKEYEVSYCSGNGGNKIFIFKDIPFVIVITASAYNSPTAHRNANKIMTDYILPAIIEN